MGATKRPPDSGAVGGRAIVAISALAAALALGACRAQVGVADGGGGEDLASDGDGAVVDLAPPADLVGADLACTAAAGPEQCNNGCDDDGNGLVDGDDPACTPQLIATLQNGSPTLDRLLLPSGMAPFSRALDGNATGPAVFAAHVRSFDPAVYVVREGGSKLLRRLTLSPMGTGTYSDYLLPFAARDVCIFGGDLIVIERGTSFGGTTYPSLIHRFAPDGRTERGTPVSLGPTLATACASDGTQLYVSVHDYLGGKSEFRVFNDAYAPVSTLPLPAGLAAWQRTAETLDRCLDFAWTPTGGWYGLFVDAGGSLNDQALSGDRLFRFDWDGGVPAALDAGLLHGIGDFR